MEAQAEFKSEYYNGEIFATAGASEIHNLIASNFLIELGMRLKGTKCRAYNSDQKVSSDFTESFMYPDISVICGPSSYSLGRKDVLSNPSLVVEVLSESTAAWDRGRKLMRYFSIPSLQQYVLVDQENYRVDVYSRDKEGNKWTFEIFSGLDVSVELLSLGLSIEMSEIYQNVELTGGEILLKG